MDVIVPTAVTLARIDDINIPLDDAPEWNIAYAPYGEGDVVLFHSSAQTFPHVWESLVDTNSAQPDEGATAEPPTWLDLGVANRYRMFDRSVSTQAVNNGTIEVSLTMGQISSSVAVLNINGQVIDCTVTDPSAGVVYHEEVQLQDNSEVEDWWTYYFTPIGVITEVIFDDLPAYVNASIEIVIDAGVNDAKCGEIVVGAMKNIGRANYDTSVGITDYSLKTTDAFGNTFVQQGAYNKRAEYDVTVETTRVSVVQRLLAGLRAVPAVYIGDDGIEATIVYGFYKDFDIIISSPSLSRCSLEVEGLT